MWKDKNCHVQSICQGRKIMLVLFLCGLLCSIQTTAKSIPYTVAQGYFLKNNIENIPTPKITSYNEFNRLFGCAAVMGKDGMPTKIDFSKVYIIAVSKPETYRGTEMRPVSLSKNKKGHILFTYKVIERSKQSYSTVPCLLIIVKKCNKGNIYLKEIKESLSK